jgi:hypothetical protein
MGDSRPTATQSPPAALVTATLPVAPRQLRATYFESPLYREP